MDLEFETIELTENQLFDYVTKRWKITDRRFESPYWLPGTFASGIKRSLLEYGRTSVEEIDPYLNSLTSADFKRQIMVGDMFAVLDFDIGFGWKEIFVDGFTTPKKVQKVNMLANGKIKNIEFADGSVYPRYTPANYGTRPIGYAVYFKTKEKATATLSFAVLSVPAGWEIIVDENIQTK